jgi:hypothetical protein
MFARTHIPQVDVRNYIELTDVIAVADSPKKNSLRYEIYIPFHQLYNGEPLTRPAMPRLEFRRLPSPYQVT